VAIPQRARVEDIRIRTVGVCPGSGASVIGAADPKPDLVFTGEMSHHDALAVTERGGCVVSLFHSNSERGFLWGVMREALEESVTAEWARVRDEFRRAGKTGDGKVEDGAFEEVLSDESVDVVVSEWDRDPYGIVVLEESESQGVVLSVEEEEAESET
jgi:hypothetical protein